MLAQEAGEITLAIDRYHQALAIHSTDPIATFLLEKALKEQVDLGACKFDGLPGSLMDPELDPFGFTDERVGSVGAMGQNRLLLLPPFPDFGALEAEREKREREGEEVDVEVEADESLTTLDETGVASLEGEVDLDADVEEEGEEASDDDEDDGGEFDGGENTAMSVSMSMSMERDESGSGGAGDDVDDEDERMSITMDLE